MIVAFMGNDGSGKTTAIKLLQGKLVNSGKRITYVSGFTHCFLDKFKKWFQKVAKIDIDKMQKEYGNSKRRRTHMLFYLWPYLVFIDCLCLFIKYRFQFQKIVMLDRYFYDYAISFKNLGVNSWLEEFIFLMLPKPDNCYVFDVSAAVAYGRKKATHKSELDYFEKQRIRYLWLAKKKNIPVINTDMTKPEEIAQRIFDQLFQKNKRCA